MASRITAALACALLFAAPVAAQTVLLDDNFDSYADQAAFEAVWTPVASSQGGTNFLQTAADTGDTIFPVSAPNMIGHATTGTRNERIITATGEPSATNVISFEIDFHDTNAANFPYRVHHNLQVTTAPTLTNQLVSIGLMNTLWPGQDGGNYYFGRILGYTPTYQESIDPLHPNPAPAGSAWFKLNEGGEATLRSTGWHNLRVEISSDDGAGTDYKFYVDDILAKTVNDIGTIPRSYDVVRLGSGLSSGTVSYSDNIKLELLTGVDPGGDDADFDGDGDVDGNDFIVWQQGIGAGDQPDGDANGDNVVDGLDLDIWEQQYAQPAPPVSAIPEPATLVLLGLAALAGLAVNRRQ